MQDILLQCAEGKVSTSAFKMIYLNISLSIRRNVLIPIKVTGGLYTISIWAFHNVKKARAAAGIQCAEGKVSTSALKIRL